MNGIGTPDRRLFESEAARLAELDTDGTRPRVGNPKQLAVGDIAEAPAVFQPRYDSIAFAPGSSEKHIIGLTAVAATGNPLDPVTVVAFGPQWYLIDGHHRLQAYRAAKWQGSIPVAAPQSNRRGRERVQWAYQASNAENGKNRLNLSPGDKTDAAWRAVLMDYGSKAETARAFSVSDGLVANMRRTKATLLGVGWTVGELGAWTWRRALFEASRGDASPDTFDRDEKLKHLLARRLKPVLEMQPPATMLLEMLEAARPGITLELETVIDYAKEQARFEANSLLI